MCGGDNKQKTPPAHPFAGMGRGLVVEDGDLYLNRMILGSFRPLCKMLGTLG